MAEVQYEVSEHLSELVDNSLDGCLATQAVKGNLGPVAEMRQLLRPRATTSANTMCATAAKCRALTGSKPDDRPCMWCGDASDHATMVLCDRCNACYHPQCTADYDRMKVHGGPWFSHANKGFLALLGAPDMM